MYEQFFGLRERPFELTPNPRYLFLTRQHREALSTLIYGLSSAKGITESAGFWDGSMRQTFLIRSSNDKQGTTKYTNDTKNKKLNAERV